MRVHCLFAIATAAAAAAAATGAGTVTAAAAAPAAAAVHRGYFAVVRAHLQLWYSLYQLLNLSESQLAASNFHRLIFKRHFAHSSERQGQTLVVLNCSNDSL